MTNDSLRDRTAIVVGGSSGIGYAIAKAALEQGARVWIVGRNPAKLERAKAELSGKVETASVDMGDRNTVREFFDRYEAASVDHLAITAATAVQGAFADVEIDEIETMFASKFFGPYRVVQAALPKLRQ
ncbi:MAG: SDR family NAD(P)-dependent oxidoreductase, partial [Cyanobacteria bacterium J06639_1]